MMLDTQQEKIMRKYQQCVPVAFMMSGSGWIVPVQQNVNWTDPITIMVPMNIPQVDRIKHIATIASNFAFLQDLHCNAGHITHISAPLSVKWGNHHLEGQLFVFSPSEDEDPQRNRCRAPIVDTPISGFVGEATFGNYLHDFFNGDSCMMRLQNWAIKQGWATTKDVVLFTRRVCNKKKFVLQEWRKVEPSYFIATNMDGNVTREGISLIPQDLTVTETKNYENPHIATLELHPISERALEEFNDRTKVTFGEFEKPSDEMAFYGNVFDTDVYAPRFEFEENSNNMDKWELHKNGLMNAHSKSTHKEVFVYPTQWKKETEDKNIQTTNNYNEYENEIEIELCSEKDEDKKPKAQDVITDLALFNSPVFRAPVHVATVNAAMARPTIPHLLLQSNEHEKSLFFKAVLEEAGIDTNSAQKRSWDEAGFDSDSTPEAEFV
jgi:hypothetical protein